MSIIDSIFFIIFILIDSSTCQSYQNHYEPRVFDYLPSNCYDCLSYRDIILTQLTDVPARSFAQFHLGSLDTNLILNGHEKLILHPYAFQSLIVDKPNRTLTITFAAPNSWLNISSNTFHGLDLQAYSTLRLVIKFFYGCTFHSSAFAGIHMGPSSRLILDLSSVTEIHFESNLMKENDLKSSMEILVSRTETIHFDRYAFSSIELFSRQSLSFHFELISHIHFKSHSFQSIRFHPSSSLKFDGIFLTRLTIDSYAFHNLTFDSHAIFNMSVRTLGTCLCFQPNSFDSLKTHSRTRSAMVLFQFYGLRGLSFLPSSFANLSFENEENQLKIFATNPLNDPNSIINFAPNTFTSQSSGLLILNFSEVNVVRLEKNAVKSSTLRQQMFFRDITLIDLSAIDLKSIRKLLQIYFDQIRFVKWPFERQSTTSDSSSSSSLIRLHIASLSNSSCLVYSAPRSVPWFVSVSNRTSCNCPLLFAYKHGQLDGQMIPCLQSMSGYETAEQMHRCRFDERQDQCAKTIESLTEWNQTDSTSIRLMNSWLFDRDLLRQLYDRNYLSCSANFSFFTSSSIVVRSRLFDNFGLVLGIILGTFLFLLIIVVALLNGLQYKMREYDEAWTWRRTMSWSQLRRTLSQTSLRRSRRDLRTVNERTIATSKSDNQLDRLRTEQDDFRKSQSIQEDLKKFQRM